MLAIIQARFSSRRLPGKVLKPLAHLPLLGWTVDRLRQCRSLSKIVLTTSDTITDDPVADYGQYLGLDVYRGPLNDVTTRFCQVILSQKVSSFVRICGDSPLIDPNIVDQAVSLYHHHNCDLVTNVFPRSFPKGQSVEVMTTDSFMTAVKQDCMEREHITQMYYLNSHRYQIINFTSGLNLAHIQLSVDTLEDYESMIKLIYACKEKPGSWQELVKIKEGMDDYKST